MGTGDNCMHGCCLYHISQAVALEANTTLADAAIQMVNALLAAKVAAADRYGEAQRWHSYGGTSSRSL